MIARRFRVTCSAAGVWLLLHRHGWSWQTPARRALERDEDAVALVEEGRVAAGGTTAAALGAWLVFEDEAGFAMTPPHARTWGPRGHTPVVRVRGRSRRRISIAALVCYKAGEKSRLIYRPRIHLQLKGARKSFAWTDYRDLLVSKSVCRITRSGYPCFGFHLNGS